MWQAVFAASRQELCVKHISMVALWALGSTPSTFYLKGSVLAQQSAGLAGSGLRPGAASLSDRTSLLKGEKMAEAVGILLIALLVCFLLLRIRLFKRTTLCEYEKGLCYKRGKFLKMLEPGVYWHWGWITRIQKYDYRKKNISIAGQEVMTSDGITIKLSFVTEYTFADLEKAIHQYENYYNAFYYDIQTCSRTVIGNLKAEELLEKRDEISRTVFESAQEKARIIGLEIHSLSIKDIMFPGSLKDIFAQVLKAQKQAQADLERARGQSASLRHLANAAKMMDNNPSLLNLRLIQAVSEGTGNTVVLKTTGDTAEKM
jgi:regulator of protease activity HflC (stomatin/prohibitin superfamily)